MQLLTIALDLSDTGHAIPWPDDGTGKPLFKGVGWAELAKLETLCRAPWAILEEAGSFQYAIVDRDPRLCARCVEIAKAGQ